MSIDFAQYEKDCERIRQANVPLLKGFEGWLREKGLTEKTIKKHVGNVDFYINEFLLYEDPTEAKDGSYSIDSFLGYWFIKKAAWASKASIKENAASLKKFYTYLLELGVIDKAVMKDLKATIKEEMPEWLATLERYDDPSITGMGEVWGMPTF